LFSLEQDIKLKPHPRYVSAAMQSSVATRLRKRPADAAALPAAAAARQSGIATRCRGTPAAAAAALPAGPQPWDLRQTNRLSADGRIIPLTLTFCNRRGGCGKTTNATAVAYALAYRGYDVLFIDTDAQTDASQFFLAQKLDDEQKNFSTQANFSAHTAIGLMTM